MNECIANVVALIDAEARRSSIEIVVDTDPETPRILADTVEIEQLVFNLVRNALESLQRASGETFAAPTLGRAALDVQPEALGTAAGTSGLVRARADGQAITPSSRCSTTATAWHRP